MHRFRNFADLRLNRTNLASDTTLWPSFTDIMTVILMVFMLTMVVVIIKNSDLLEQIRLSRHLQAESEQKLQDAQQVLADLRVEKTDLEDAIRSARMEIILLTDRMERLQDDLDVKAAAIARFGDEKAELEENLRLIRLQLTEKETELADAEVLISGLREEAERANRDLRRQIAELLAALEKNEATLLQLSDEKSDLEMTLARQRQDFSSLEEKYLALVRPARSAAGKQIVSVQLVRTGENLHYLLKEIGGSAWREMTRAAMFARLEELKAELGDELYVKVVIPDDSGLSYNEAWDFTKSVLSQFDYYYKDGW